MLLIKGAAPSCGNGWKKIVKKRKQSQMNKQPITLRTYLPRGAFLLSLALVIVMPLAVAQSTPTARTCRSKISNIGGVCGFGSGAATRSGRMYDIGSAAWTTGAP